MSDLSQPLGEVSFTCVDVETTGLDPRRDAIIEIGAVKVQGGAIVNEFETLVSIDRPIPAGALRVHGITAEMLAGAPHIGEALPLLWTFSGDGPLVEHSYEAFDVAFLEHAHGSPLTMPFVNTCTLSRRLFPFHKSHSLENCCQRFAIINPRKHRALSDARATAQLLMKLLELSGTRYPRLEDLVAVASVERSGKPRRPRARAKRG